MRVHKTINVNKYTIPTLDLVGYFFVIIGNKIKHIINHFSYYDKSYI